MIGIFGSIFLGGCGFVSGLIIGKSIIQSGKEGTAAAGIIMLAMGIFFMCGSIWVGLLNGWI